MQKHSGASVGKKEYLQNFHWCDSDFDLDLWCWECSIVYVSTSHTRPSDFSWTRIESGLGHGPSLFAIHHYVVVDNNNNNKPDTNNKTTTTK